MKSRTVTTMITMMVVLLVVPLLNVEGQTISGPPPRTTPMTAPRTAPRTTPQATSASPTSQSQQPTTPATMHATATPTRTQTTGPTEVVSTSGTTSMKEDATALSIDQLHRKMNVVTIISCVHLGVDLLLVIGIVVIAVIRSGILRKINCIGKTD
ncbi:G8 domain-containing protein DDB_G0286311-like [Sycon ciliatum]|uniref:G8 domain-containing protein DDB_G0286311-like n=1 Tax=Sycon ciliatum TaxID=27933 RepID=UPI0031F63A7A